MLLPAFDKIHIWGFFFLTSWYQAAVLRHYEATLATCNALDYHDFITFSVHLLENHPQGTPDLVVAVQSGLLWNCKLYYSFTIKIFIFWSSDTSTSFWTMEYGQYSPPVCVVQFTRMNTWFCTLHMSGSSWPLVVCPTHLSGSYRILVSLDLLWSTLFKILSPLTYQECPKRTVTYSITSLNVIKLWTWVGTGQCWMNARKHGRVCWLTSSKIPA